MLYKQKKLFFLGALGAFFGAFHFVPVFAAPVISEVTLLFSTSSAQVSWTTTDSQPIISGSLKFGKDTNYILTSTLQAVPGNVSGTKYFFASKIKNLSPGEKIYYQIKTGNESSESSLYSENFIFPLPDTKAPVVSSVKVVALIDETAISFLTNEDAFCRVGYAQEGERQQYKNESNYAVSHRILLDGIQLSTNYDYQIFCADRSGNKSESQIQVFTSFTKNPPPAKVSGFSAAVFSGGVNLIWKNPNDQNFDKVQLIKSTIGFVSSLTEGELLYEGRSEKFFDTKISTGTTYYYTIFSLDNLEQTRGGVSVEFVYNLPTFIQTENTTSSSSQNSTTTNLIAGEKPALQQIADTAVAIREYTEKKEVKQTVSTVVAPTAVGVAAVSAVSVFSFVNILAFFQLLLQPFIFLKRKKHTTYGFVYNSLNKLPIDLATVRLLNRETGQVVQSKVTDRDGRYLFVVNPGLYRLVAIKSGFVFPSNLLQDINDDGQKTNIYHGQTVETSASNGVIALNIPMDPAGDYELPIVKLWWQKALKLAQTSLVWVGLIIILISLYISPKWYIVVLLFVQIFILLTTRRLSQKPAAKSWGIVTDAITGRPVNQVIVRLFNAELDKLVSTQITDSRGRYFFLASDAKYYITLEHTLYEGKKSDIVDLKNKRQESIIVDIKLNPKKRS